MAFVDRKDQKASDLPLVVRNPLEQPSETSSAVGTCGQLPSIVVSKTCLPLDHFPLARTGSS